MKKICIYNPYLESKGGGEKVCLALAHELSANKNNQVFLIAHSEVDLKPLEKYFNVDLSKVNFINIDTERWYLKLLFKLPVLGGFKFFVSDLYVARKLRRLNCDVFINNCYQSKLPNMGKKGVYMCMFPQKLTTKPEEIGRFKSYYKNFLTWLYEKFIYKSKQAGVFTYDSIVANSAYTQSYIKKYWGLDSEILYPICENMYDPSIKKESIIFNVGRFFGFDEGSHHKRQDFLLKAFTDLKEMQKNGWQLHFAGSIANDKFAKKFVANLQKDATGLPVVFHFDASFAELKELYNKATIYWHATGYGSAPDKFPEKQEHFGISTVEAMSANAIPIVINTAGQKEVVRQGRNGFLWDNQAELEEFTNKIPNLSQQEQAKLHNEASKTVAQYNDKSFAKNINEIFGSYLD